MSTYIETIVRMAYVSILSTYKFEDNQKEVRKASEAYILATVLWANSLNVYGRKSPTLSEAEILRATENPLIDR